MVERKNLTSARIDAETLPSKGHRDMWDAEVRGLVVRLTPGGGVFYLSKWDGKETRWIRLGAHPETKVKDARALALDKLAAIQRGEKPWDQKNLMRAEAALSDLWDAHKAHAEGKKRGSTLALYARAWELLKPLHGKRVSSITKGDIQSEVNRIGKTRPVMANRCHSLIGVLYSTAIDAETYKGSNPATGVVRFYEKSRDRFLRPDELRAWWQALEYEPENWRLYFAAAVLCGARKSNVCAMRWADLDTERGLWRVPGEQSKNGEPLIVILPATLLTLLADWRRRCPSKSWVFPTHDQDAIAGHVRDPKRPWARVVNRATLFRYVQALAEANGWDVEAEAKARADALAEAESARVRALGRREAMSSDPLEYAADLYAKRVIKVERDPADYTLADIRIHDLRRTLGSWATITGASLPIVGRALGHRSMSATQVYARLSIDPVRDAVETAAGAIIGHGGDAATRVMTNERSRP